MVSSSLSPSNAAPSVCCVLLNWNGWKDTITCLDSLSGQDYPNLRILVVDNASTDDSVALIRSAHPDVAIIEAEGNVGFSRGCNLALREAAIHGDEYIWLLNNDTIAPPDTCSKLVARALAEPSAGLIGSVLYFMHAPSQVQAWGGGNVNSWLGRGENFTSPAPLGSRSFLTFASVLIPREVLFRVGVLYEGSFMYWEDADYSLRVTAAGYSLAIAEDTAILHKEGGSTSFRDPVVDRYSAVAGLHFLRRHSPMPHLSMAIFIAVRLVARVLRRAWKNFQAVLLACSDYWTHRKTVYRDML